MFRNLGYQKHFVFLRFGLKFRSCWNKNAIILANLYKNDNFFKEFFQKHFMIIN